MTQLRQHVPRSARRTARGVQRFASSLLYTGHTVSCPCCGGRFRAFMPYRGRPGAMCPRCGALERHRLLALYLRERLRLDARPTRLLHIAPERALERVLRPLPTVEYVSGDLTSPRAMVKLDVTALPFADETFDAVICNHVLEHVPDDRKALSELYRVLRTGGWALILSALWRSLPETREDPSVTDPAERERLFGQSDHVRIYGLDYAARLEAAGFEVTVEAYDRVLGAEAARTYGLLPGEDVYRCDKAPSPGRGSGN